MVLNSIRFGQLASVIPFPKQQPAAAPQFAATLPPIQRDRNIKVSRRYLDMFQPAEPRTARIILRPEETMEASLKARLERKISSLQKKIAQDGVPGGQKVDPLAVANELLVSMLAGGYRKERKLDKLGNVVVPFTASRVEYAEGDDAQAKVNKLQSTGRANTRMLLANVKDQLEKLPKHIEEVTVDLPQKMPDGVDKAELLREMSTLITLQGYNYNFQKQYKFPTSRLDTVYLNKYSLPTGAEGAKIINEGQAIGEAMNLTRHLVDAPANFKTTLYMSNLAKGLASPTLNVTVREKDWITQQGMGLLLSVGQGNDHTRPDRDPRLVEMVYTPKDGKYDKTILLVGKGIVFDTGGNNLKPSEFIHSMEGDMAGAAAVISTMKALDKVGLKGVRVVGLAPLTENRIGSSASLPNDIYTSRSGKTVQIANTDAEGRLILADAMHYGMETYKPDVVADIATLTGGKTRGVGEQNSVALSGNHRELMTQVDKLEKNMGVVSLALPLTQSHHNWVTRAGKGKADVFNSVSVADAKLFGVISPNNPDPREPMLQHSAQGAAFLREFLPKGMEKTPWVHYDIAGTTYDKPDPKRGNEEWGTGFGVKELYFLVKGLTDGSIKADPVKTETIKPGR